MTEKQREEHVVGDLSDFPEGTHRVVKVGRREIGVFNIEGEYFGLPNVCPHQTGPLCEGKPPLGTLVSREENAWKFEWIHDGEIVACPWHGLEYHIPTGRCLAFPKVTLRSYEVVAEDGKVKVRLQLEPDLPTDPQVDGKLAVREENEVFLVVREEDPDDWLVRFDKGDGFPARAWAENMVRVYNRRLRRRSAAPPTPPGTRPLSYHPDSEG